MINVDLTCAVQTFGNVATQLDYFIKVPATSTTFEETAWLGEHPVHEGMLSDSLTTKVRCP